MAVEIGEKTSPSPFIRRFEETVKTEDLVLPPGKYNEEMQVWEWEEPGTNLQKASFPRQERPPTISTVVTWLPKPQLPKTDMGPDD